eukprot:TRINITY_DN2754_c0_g1_i1.p1 TRINITY_DN2754_c0_g1~~TRINITY_DN2754_c0_g1_i1.p1  ORF type:complete len:211 (+),score=26.60 TRINITY_DN2754_c0_g1_i1:148-780(+)
MKVLSIVICKSDGRKDSSDTSSSALPILLSTYFELGSFGYFQRGSLKEVCLFVSREVLQRGIRGERQTVKHQEYMCHSYISPTGGIGVAVITDQEYPTRVAYGLIQRSLDEFSSAHSSTKIAAVTSDVEWKLDSIETLLREYQDPSKSDSVTKIQKDLDETKDVLVKTIDQLLERGEKLENLAQKSNDLSMQSKAFMNNADRLNSCCTIL